VGEYGDSAGGEGQLFDASVSVRASDVDEALVIRSDGNIAGLIGSADFSRGGAARDVQSVIRYKRQELTGMGDGEVGEIRRRGRDLASV
jgi:hypothetical protein